MTNWDTGMVITSGVWGNVPETISQGLDYGYRPDWYQYTGDYGLKAGTHGGLDVVMPAGTRIYALSYGQIMPETPGPGGPPSDSFRPRPVWEQTMDDPATPQVEPSGWVEIYGHMSDDAVKAGQIVHKGDLLGVSGEQTIPGTLTPDGSGAHLHFELREPTPGATPSGFTIVNPGDALSAGIFQGTGAMPLSNGGSGGGSDLGIGALTASLQDFATRFLFGGIGVIVLLVGIIAVTQSGGSIGGAARKAAKVAVFA